MSDPYVLITDVAKEVGRSADTLRKWDKRMPPSLRSVRGPRRRRYWRSSQIPQIKQWAVANRMFTGGSLPHVKLSEEEIKQRVLGTKEDNE